MPAQHLLGRAKHGTNPHLHPHAVSRNIFHLHYSHGIPQGVEKRKECSKTKARQLTGGVQSC